MPRSAGVTRMGREQKCLLKLYVEKTSTYLVLLMCLLLCSTPIDSLTCLAMFKLLKASQVVSPAHSAAAHASLGSHATSLSLCFVEGWLLIQRCLLRSQQPDCIVRKELAKGLLLKASFPDIAYVLGMQLGDRVFAWHGGGTGVPTWRETKQQPKRVLPSFPIKNVFRERKRNETP